MKKKLDEEGIANELRSGSAFFKRTEQEVIQPEKEAMQPVEKKNTKRVAPRQQLKAEQQKQSDTAVSWFDDDAIEHIRKAVKQPGKEAATYRFTAEEKKALADIVYTYKTQGVRTSENEVTRASINFIVQDYEQNGENSVLAKVLASLNS